MSVLKIKDENGNWIGITSIKGDKGDKGDVVSPEEIGAATAEDMVQAQSDIGMLQGDAAFFAAHTSNTNNPHGVTPAQIGAATVGHLHDERYYTETEVNALLANKAPFPTWGTEDIEAGSASASPTGTVHYVIE